MEVPVLISFRKVICIYQIETTRQKFANRRRFDAFLLRTRYILSLRCVLITFNSIYGIYLQGIKDINVNITIIFF